ncbi:TIR domain-containing protein [Clostridium sp. YIM B02555]|uniref:TIR domain-containing protein n=1 Tax=Clostridium sp. YIM B02555 TaxID=2911968 RepID=UPI001EED9109|nr:TIR domain-containing protein [Clostridium sp. YIM B02555]
MQESSNSEKQDLTPKRPLVFISHDTRDAEISEAFSKLLSSVSAGVLKSFRTSDKKGNQGIEYGVEWYPEIMKKLQEATSVVCLLTDNSINRPWILFEAGVAKGKLDTSILGICIGIPLSKANSGPFAQFQNCGDDEDSLTKLVLQLVKTIPNSEPDEQVIKGQVNLFKEKINSILKTDINKGKIKNIDKSVDDNIGKELAIAGLYEEMKIMLKDLPARIQSNLSSNNDINKRSRKVIPMRVLDEMIEYSSRFNIDTGIKMILGLCRNDFPWIYEIGIEALNISRSNSSSRIEDGFMNFQKTLDITRKFMILGSDDEYYNYIFDRLYRMMRDYYEDFMMRKRSKREITESIG